MFEFAGLIIGVIGGLITAYGIYNGRNTRKIISAVEKSIGAVEKSIEKADERAELRHKEIIELLKKGFSGMRRNIK